MSKDAEISVELAKKILSACYEIDAMLREIVAASDANQVIKATQTLTTLVGAEIMVPIYFSRPELGRIMQPGDWLRTDLAASKFGVHD